MLIGQHVPIFTCAKIYNIATDTMPNICPYFLNYTTIQKLF